MTDMLKVAAIIGCVLLAGAALEVIATLARIATALEALAPK